MVIKSHSGFETLDDAFGGVFEKRCFLVNGKSGSGKTVLGLQYTYWALQNNERCLYLSTMAANDLTILAYSLG
jgi:KaiC/GvpD/RAD55 family RecA-like ATPase